MDEYNKEIAMQAQKNLCNEKGYPHFAPETGVCWNCGKNIYEPIGWKQENGHMKKVALNSQEVEYVTGITVEKAAKDLITSCPHCNKSFCD